MQDLNSNSSSSDDNRQSMQGLPRTYFDLIEKVGSKGTYQTVLFIIFALNWMVAGFIVMQPVFLFLNREFACEKQGLLSHNCPQYACSFNSIDIQKKFLDEGSHVSSLSTQYGPYICQQTYKATLFKMVEYIGIFSGYFVFLYFTDNYGRKMSAVMTWSVTITGIAILCASVSIQMAVLGLFLAGAGCESSMRITMTVLGQVADYYLRQQYSVALQIAFAIGGILVGIAYWVLPSWRLINITFILIPCIIIDVLFIFYFEQTPKFLIKKGTKEAVKGLNRIGLINKKIHSIITEEDIENVKKQNMNEKQFDKKMLPTDLFRYKSLRYKAICLCIMFLLTTYLYYGPIFIVDRLGFNPYLSQVIVVMSQLVAYPISFQVIERVPRRKSGFICYGVSIFFSLSLVIIGKPADCDNCFQSYLQVFGIFASRFFVSFYLSVLFIYVTELYPLRARGMGFGVASAAGALAVSGVPILQFFNDHNISPLGFFGVCGILAIAALLFLPETRNVPLADQIQEIQEEKDHLKNLQVSS